MNTINFSTSDHDFRNLAARVIAESEPTVVNMGTGESVVIMPLDEFNAWQETAYLLKNPANAAHLEKSIKEARSGKVVEHKLDEQ